MNAIAEALRATTEDGFDPDLIYRAAEEIERLEAALDAEIDIAGDERIAALKDKLAAAELRIKVLNDLCNRRAAFGASELTDGLAGKRTE